MRWKSLSRVVPALAIPAAGVVLFILAVQHKQNLRPEPGDFTAYEVERVPPDKVGYTEPRVVVPGDVIKLVVYRGQERCISGLWRADEVRLSPLPVRAPDGAEILWKPTEVQTSTRVWDDTIQINRPNWPGLSLKNAGPLRPWVRFRLPDDERLVGQVLRVQIHLAGVYPAPGITRDTFTNYAFEVDDEVAFQVGTRSEIAAYRNHIADWDAWRREDRAGPVIVVASLALLVITVVTGAGLLWSAISSGRQD